MKEGIDSFQISLPMGVFSIIDIFCSSTHPDYSSSNSFKYFLIFFTEKNVCIFL